MPHRANNVSTNIGFVGDGGGTPTSSASSAAGGEITIEPSLTCPLFSFRFLYGFCMECLELVLSLSFFMLMTWMLPRPSWERLRCLRRRRQLNVRPLSDDTSDEVSVISASTPCGAGKARSNLLRRILEPWRQFLLRLGVDDDDENHIECSLEEACFLQ
jgi:hypothetical protein